MGTQYSRTIAPNASNLRFTAKDDGTESYRYRNELTFICADLHDNAESFSRAHLKDAGIYRRNAMILEYSTAAVASLSTGIAAAASIPLFKQMKAMYTFSIGLGMLSTSLASFLYSTRYKSPYGFSSLSERHHEVGCELEGLKEQINIFMRSDLWNPSKSLDELKSQVDTFSVNKTTIQTKYNLQTSETSYQICNTKVEARRKVEDNQSKTFNLPVGGISYLEKKQSSITEQQH